MSLDCFESGKVGVNIGEDCYSHIFLYHELREVRERQLRVIIRERISISKV
jgi:hypothetical protein